MAPIARLAGFLAILTLVPGGFSSPMQKSGQTLQSRGLLRRIAPQPSYCVCNENGCEDSPGCCGNGTCPPRAAPLEVTTKDFDDCSDDQKKAIQGAMDDLSSLATKASEIIGKNGSKTSNKGYAHYFTENDLDSVKSGFKALISAADHRGDKVKWNFKCGTEDQCKNPDGTTSFAITDIVPEDYKAPEHKPKIEKGTRNMMVCPLFFDETRTKRRLPDTENEEEKEKFCKFKDTNKLKDYETGGHTLLHEITHLDSWGVEAGFDTQHVDADEDAKLPEFDYHGTDDWKGDGSSGNARRLTNSKAKNRIPNFKNAESFAACATELFFMDLCGIKEIDL